MTHSVFGWSYPAGCSGPPDADDGITDLQDSILGLLEDAGIDEKTNDAIMALVRAAEIAKYKADDEASEEFMPKQAAAEQAETSKEDIDQ